MNGEDASVTLVNGAVVDCVSARDRGLAYGDGLFETVAVRAGMPCHWDEHAARLAQGCDRLRIEPPDPGLLRGEALRVCEGVERGVLKVIVTRGVGGRGYCPDPARSATRIVSLHPWPEGIETRAVQGVRVRICSLRLAVQPLLAGIKHLNRIEQVLARAEWNDPDIVEGLLLDAAGHVIEATACNLFLVVAGTLLTPDVSQSGVAGLQRARILRHAAEAGIATRVAVVSQDHLARAQEMFLCNSIIGIWPVTDCDGLRYPVGPLTRRLQALCMTNDQES